MIKFINKRRSKLIIPLLSTNQLQLFSLINKYISLIIYIIHACTTSGSFEDSTQNTLIPKKSVISLALK